MSWAFRNFKSLSGDASVLEEYHKDMEKLDRRYLHTH